MIRGTGFAFDKVTARERMAGTMNARTRIQLMEALGPVNQWFCSQHYRRPINDPETLVRYYVHSGGSTDFARRYNEAMGLKNRQYCSEFYGREVREAEILWDYYMSRTTRGIAC